jgi:hypothetical protein
MQTYLVSNGVNVKIGHADDAMARICELEGSIYNCFGIKWKLQTLLILEGDFETELHLHFAKDRIGGEWFRPSAELESFIRASAKDEAVSIPYSMLEIRDLIISRLDHQNRLLQAQEDKWRRVLMEHLKEPYQRISISALWDILEMPAAGRTYSECQRLAKVCLSLGLSRMGVRDRNGLNAKGWGRDRINTDCLPVNR